MSKPPEAGDVLKYSYLWLSQSSHGETEGRKTRPTAIAITYFRKDGQTTMILMAITTKMPRDGQIALEIPLTERRRANLDWEKPLWIILNEYNVDVLENSHYFLPESVIGRFSLKFLNDVQRAFRSALMQGAKRVARFDD